MIAAWMVYAVVVSCLVAVAAQALEVMVRPSGRPTRWIWLGALGTAVGLPTLRSLWQALASSPGPAADLPGWAPQVILDPVTNAVAQESVALRLDPALALLWVALSGGILLSFAAITIRTRRLRSSWEEDRIRETSVLLSEDLGPAVVGFFHSIIVLPRWCGEVDPDRQDLILAHELEHLRAGDLRVLFLSFLAVLAMPWNVPLWWMIQRLRLAVEADCDTRVLRRFPGRTRAYGELLLEVGLMSSRHRLAGAMLSESKSTLERRIDLMTRSIPEKVWRRGFVWGAVAGLCIAVACYVDADVTINSDGDAVPEEPAAVAQPQVDPTGDAPTDETPPRLVEPDEVDPTGVRRSKEELEQAPTFTPYTVRPDIKNRAQVARAMEENYPPLLRDAGIGGTVSVWFFVEETGEIGRLMVNESSGHEELDDAALRVAASIQFTPALNDGDPVPVWISLPITFTTR
jgi:TonB family protein